MANLSNKIALVTGASRGIGKATALALARDGARVLVHYGQSKEEADAVVATIREAGGEAQAFQASLETGDGAHLLAEKVRGAVNGKLDILIANAGVSKSIPMEDLTVAEFDRLFAINVRSPYFLVQQLLPVLGEGAAVTFVSSVLARTAIGTLAAYGATKGAVDTLVRHLAAAFGPRGIRVNAVAPGAIDTDMSSFTKSEAGRKALLSMQALQRIAVPDDVAEILTFLSSDAARWVTGQIIGVDGGTRL